MEFDVGHLQRMTAAQLRRRHFELFGVLPRSNHRQFLFRQLAWKLQAATWGGLSEELRSYALALVRNSSIRTRIAEGASGRVSGLPPARTVRVKLVTRNDSRLPLRGSLVIKEFRGVMHVVKVLDDGFEYCGRDYRSLSAIAHQISGTKWNGYTFFGLRSGG